MTHFVIEMPHQDFAFEGKLIAGPTSNRMGDSGKLRSRWLQLTLYRTLEGRVYVVERVSKSVVVHAPGAPCVPGGKAFERGRLIPAEELPEDAVPCCDAEPPWRRRCYPDLSPGLRVRLEQDRPTIFRSSEAADVIRWLSEAHYSAGGVSDMMSRPVAALLEQAARKDQAFRVHPVVTIV